MESFLETVKSKSIESRDFSSSGGKADITGESGMGHGGKRAELNLAGRAKSAVGGKRKLGKAR